MCHSSCSSQEVQTEAIARRTQFRRRHTHTHKRSSNGTHLVCPRSGTESFHFHTKTFSETRSHRCNVILKTLVHGFWVLTGNETEYNLRMCFCGNDSCDNSDTQTMTHIRLGGVSGTRSAGCECKSEYQNKHTDVRICIHILLVPSPMKPL